MENLNQIIETNILITCFSGGEIFNGAQNSHFRLDCGAIGPHCCIPFIGSAGKKSAIFFKEYYCVKETMFMSMFYFLIFLASNNLKTD